MSDTKFMKLALMEAKKAAIEGEVPIGAVLVKDSKVIAKAHNLKESKKDATAHAEILVIKKASKKLNNWRLLDTTLYVTLEPCAMCASAISQARIKRVVYALDDENNGAIKNTIKLYTYKSINQLPQVTSGVLEKDAKQILQTFFKKKRK
ncbi:MAG: tRNA adenosine(34) deaminase TadA [Bacilli bacterium]|nr:tRNA adenosine(34) deaminase TadA [Bacilli bacterium]